MGWIPSGRQLPSRDRLPRWLAPVPSVLETIGLRLVWLVVAINLAGTAFGFWYYFPQLSRTAPEMWIFVPDSPMATLFIAGAFALWAVDRSNDYLTALAFFGNIKLGLWTPWVLVIFADAFLEFTAPAMYAFLLVSHLAMVVQAFVLHRITDFPVAAVGLAVGWYTIDLTVDYFIPIVGEPHHTTIPVARGTEIAAGATAFQLAAWGAVVLTILPLFWALATRINKSEPADA
ncbi:putative membrane protein YpjA [Halohasta litchfieldiae]|uniref:Uncharacterized membrane protein YpjA n=1 Tax=Halohasta litchfieldiae TaxID=1073996 RepID=A0A1H6X3Y4_9EURY|nr:DUF1405 domain-containing protein [Halohasta litchfieldiae]ATW87297.1 putative membrane protein YpjA [Halohasta litchfieldiae]SEJ23861.1 Uncharacterized membrane protein YpjA [Halohasta litchfieldiae]